MSFEIRLSDLYRESDNYYRITEFRTGSGSFQPVSLALDNSKPLHSRFRSSVPDYALTESYAKITTNKLREIDGNRELQRKFVLENLIANQGNHLIVFLKVLLEQEERLNSSFVTHLIDILSAPENNIIIPPLLYNFRISQTGRLIPTLPVDTDIYMDFLRELLSALSSQGVNQVGINIPTNIPKSQVSTILELYKDFDTPLAALDANGKTNVDQFLIQRVLLGIGRESSHNLQEKQGENYILYSFDSKPYRGRGDIVPAMNILQLDNGFSTFGSRHTVKMRPLPPPPPGEEIPTRFVFPAEYSYARSTVPEAVEPFQQWKESNHIQDEDSITSQIKRYKRDYEYLSIGHSIEHMTDLAKEGTLDKELTSHQFIQRAFGQIKKNNRRMFS